MSSLGGVANSGEISAAIHACVDVQMLPRLLLLRGTLLVLCISELRELYSLFRDGDVKGLIDQSPTVTRLWSFVLVLLIISRATALWHPRSEAALNQLAMVHVAEAAYLGSECACSER